MIRTHQHFALILYVIVLPYYMYCSELTQFLNQYKRPITILEIGAQTPDVMALFSQHYKGTYICAHSPCTRKLLDYARQRNLKQVIILEKEYTFKDFQQLAACEHPDLTIIHFDDYSLEEFESFLKIGDYLLLTLPTANDTLTRYIKRRLKNSKIPFYPVSHQSILIHTENKILAVTSWYTKKRAWVTYHIASDFLEKKLIKKHTKNPTSITDWLPGINLQTYLALAGIYPSRYHIVDELHTHIHCTHRDTWIANFIIQGNRILMIDWEGQDQEQYDIRHTNKNIFAIKKFFTQNIQIVDRS